MIICEHLTKLFDPNSGIKDINLQFSPGIIYGIIGNNGSGKTALLNCIEGLYVPTSGFVSHDNVKTTEAKDFLPHRRKIAFLPSYDFLYPQLTCMENIELSAILRTGRNKLSPETDELIRYFEIDSFLHKRFGDCSTGMKKKAQIVVGLIGEIDTIIWDEPNDGLDIISNMKIKNLLKHYKSKKKITILLSSHVIEFLNDFVDHCVLLHEGNVIENTDIQDIGSLEKLFLNNLPQNILSINI
jgi:ABC-type multidrug transport system ATPase subunit